METKKQRRPEHFQSWEKTLQWAGEKARLLWSGFLERMRTTFRDETEKKRGRYYCFYEGKPSTDSLFMAVRLNQECIAARIRTDSGFKDEEKWTGNKIYRNWFFTKDQEREFKIANMYDVDYAITLIRQSCALAKTHVDGSLRKMSSTSSS